MNRLKAIGTVLAELFIEDARLTVALAAWIAIIAATKPWWQTAPRLAALALFGGAAVILCESVVRAARRD